MRHIIPISGKDSCATAFVQMQREPKLSYELYFSDTKAELPETYQWMEQVEKKIGLPIHKIGKSLEKIILEERVFIPSPHYRFCTRESKIRPMEDWLGEDEARIYIGLRADEENRTGYNSTKDSIKPVYPLREEGIDLNGVLTILDKHELRPPKFFWQAMYNQVVSVLDQRKAKGFGIRESTQTILNRLSPHAFDEAFAWRSRSNCSFCFFQRLYEWIGLLEHHPKLFDRAQEMEEFVSKEAGKGNYSWIPDMPLSVVRENDQRIRLSRVNGIINEIANTGSRISLDAGSSVSSCGFFCGK